ncbi:MAG: 4-amino-4-deoxy-L-arabinose transferase, partial [Planctomycetes bacterium]|nr:4-amino-4-deoxy-L-arabinose transferase [Planctomycetota bacterium]
MQTSALPSLRTLILWALLIFALTSVVGLGARPLAVPDEARYGAMGADMLTSGDWLKLRMAGFTYYEKPPLGT